jgi:hypothetical protein
VTTDLERVLSSPAMGLEGQDAGVLCAMVCDLVQQVCIDQLNLVKSKILLTILSPVVINGRRSKNEARHVRRNFFPRIMFMMFVTVILHHVIGYLEFSVRHACWSDFKRFQTISP